MNDEEFLVPLLRAWHRAFGSEFVRVAEVVGEAARHGAEVSPLAEKLAHMPFAHAVSAALDNIESLPRNRITQRAELRDALVAIGNRPGVAPFTKLKFARFLERFADKTIGPYRLVRSYDSHGKTWKWSVLKTAEPIPRAPRLRPAPKAAPKPQRAVLQPDNPEQPASALQSRMDEYARAQAATEAAQVVSSQL